MCRHCSQGGRRCPGDTSEARRARRYAAAGKQDPRVEKSLRGTPPPVADSGATEITHDLSTPEGIADRATELRTMRTGAMAGLQECAKRLQEEGGLDQETADSIMAKHGVSSSVLEYREVFGGSVLPSLSMQKYERESTALGQKVDQWLDGELASEKEAYDEAASAYGAADKAYMEAGGKDSFESVQEAYDKRAAARSKFREAHTNYYARKRELMGQLRESGQELEWTTAGTSTPARVNETIQASATFLPKDWIDSSNRLAAEAETLRSRGERVHVLPVRVRESTSRNHYSSHRHITRREVTKRQSFYSAELAKKVDVYNSPRYRIVPEEEWSENDRRFASPGDVLVQDYHVARGDSWFSTEPGVGALDEDGNFRLKGRAAAGWEEHTYTDHDGQEQTCWRKAATRTHTNREYGIAELTIPKGKGRKGQAHPTATHELIHRCEDTNSSIPQMESAFLMRRTTNEDGERDKLETYYGKEKVRPDDFIDRYVGKEYGSHRFHEVMSVGTEASFHGTCGGFGKTPDPTARTPERRDDDHHAFVLGTYMTA